jgi:RNA polymerase sigma-70 factor (ECF subfamily)
MPAAHPPTPSDEELLLRLRAGDEDAYSQVVRLHAGRLQSTARRLLGDEHEAQDAVQETFLAAFRGIDRFEGTAALSTWLHRIAVNQALQRLRKRSRRDERPLDDLLPTFVEDGHFATAPRLWADAPETELGRRELRALVRGCIDRLPCDHRTALVLRDVEEMPVAEAAAALGISENLLKVRVHRARQALRALLEPHLARSQA